MSMAVGMSIVSGGGIEFMRPWTEKIYGIPPEQVIGSSIKTKYEVRDSKPVIVRLPEIDFIDDKDGKPVGIHKFIRGAGGFEAPRSDNRNSVLWHKQTKGWKKPSTIISSDSRRGTRPISRFSMRPISATSHWRSFF
jgi:hypothetical protein